MIQTGPTAVRWTAGRSWGRAAALQPRAVATTTMPPMTRPPPTELDENGAGGESVEEINICRAWWWTSSPLSGEGDLDGRHPSSCRTGRTTRSPGESTAKALDQAPRERRRPKTVEFTDDETATLTFDILLGGRRGSGGGRRWRCGTVDGEWLVSENTFLSLYDAAKDSCTGPRRPWRGSGALRPIV